MIQAGWPTLPQTIERTTDMRFTRAEIADVIIIEPEVHRDERGFFVETYRHDEFTNAGIVDSFVQDNHTRSVARTLRGLHLQVGHPQAKLVRVAAGEIYDVAVDMRRGSRTFGRYVGIMLSADTFRQCYIPAGFAHGFCVLSPIAEVIYKCTDVYKPDAEMGIAWNDPRLAIPWPIIDPILSERDRRNPTLDDVMLRLGAS